mgnify:CR=1 FL=1
MSATQIRSRSYKDLSGWGHAILMVVRELAEEASAVATELEERFLNDES